MYRISLAVIIFLLGGVLTIGGVWLAVVGGSLYYVVAGVALAAAAILIWQRKPGGLSLYALVLLGSLAWAVWEVGFDWWALAPRGALLAVLGILLLPLAWIWYRKPPLARRYYGGSAAALAGSVAVCSAVALYAALTPSHEMDGALAADRMAVAGEPVTHGVPPGEWPAYGRTAYGQRYSPLEAITPANVDDLDEAWRSR